MPRLVGQDRTSSKRSKKYLEGEKRERVKPPDLKWRGNSEAQGKKLLEGDVEQPSLKGSENQLNTGQKQHTCSCLRPSVGLQLQYSLQVAQTTLGAHKSTAALLKLNKSCEQLLRA